MTTLPFTSKRRQREAAEACRDGRKLRYGPICVPIGDLSEMGVDLFRHGLNRIMKPQISGTVLERRIGIAEITQVPLPLRGLGAFIEMLAIRIDNGIDKTTCGPRLRTLYSGVRPVILAGRR